MALVSGLWVWWADVQLVGKRSQSIDSLLCLNLPISSGLGVHREEQQQSCHMRYKCVHKAGPPPAHNIC